MMNENDLRAELIKVSAQLGALVHNPYVLQRYEKERKNEKEIIQRAWNDLANRRYKK